MTHLMDRHPGNIMSFLANWYHISNFSFIRRPQGLPGLKADPNFVSVKQMDYAKTLMISRLCEI